MKEWMILWLIRHDHRKASNRETGDATITG